jgi:hypothetical protein
VIARRETWRHLRVRVRPELASALREVARRRSVSLSQALRALIADEVARQDAASGSAPDESAIRETAILIAVELVLKLQEASIPGGPTLSRRLLENAARAAISRIELVEARLRKETQR